MKNRLRKQIGQAISFSIIVSAFFLLLIHPQTVFSQGQIAQHILELKTRGFFKNRIAPFTIITNKDPKLLETVRKYSMLKMDYAVLGNVLSTQPENVTLYIPFEDGKRNFTILLKKEIISPGGYSLLTSDKTNADPVKNNTINYRGCLDNDKNSVVSFSFSKNETMGLISNDEGNFVVGKIEKSPEGSFIVYNDKDLTHQSNFGCADLNATVPAAANKSVVANTTVSTIVPPTTTSSMVSSTTAATPMTTKCVNWYWETDYDVFVNKGSLANVNAYMQGIFNQVATLYANDGISINLKTLFVWTTVDPYTGPSTGDYLNQFGAYRTSWNGDLAHLIGFNGNGGIAYVNGIQMCEYGSGQVSSQQGYSGISSSYSTVPTYSWTVGCITHEMGHQLGSSHTHACVWNGNNTKIDDCGGYAGYSGGTCLPQPNPVLPVGGGTIMSYCHLTSVGINFNLGFGPQPKALITGKINASSCLSACNTCAVPAQPGTISGNTAPCGSVSQTYSVTAVAGATSYTWTIPTGWSGSSTSNTITLTTGTGGGSINVTANNSCGSSVAQSVAVTGASGIPTQPGTITGNNLVCPNTSQTYSVTAVNGATNYTWTIPPGWTGSSTSNTITVTPGTTGGTLTVKANNSCGSSNAQSLSVSISSGAPVQPSSITGSTNLCSGVSTTYSTATVSGVTNYTWSLPSGWTGSSTSNSIGVTTGTTAGSVSVTANNGCGSSSATTLAVTFSGIPAIPGTITVSGGSTLVCSGDTRTYTVPLVSGLSYNWTAPAGATITSGQGSNIITLDFSSSFSTSGTLSVTAVNACGSSSARTLTISRNVPAIPSTITVSGGTTKVCPGDSRTFSVTAVTGMSYQWTLPTGATISSGDGSNSIVVSFSSSFTAAGTLAVKAVNGCGSSTSRTLTIYTNPPAVPGTIIVSGGSSSVCDGDTRTYTVTPFAGLTYNWVAPLGASIISGQGTNSITVNYTSSFTSSGTLKVSAVNSCGTSAARSLTVSRNIPSTPSAVSVSGGIAKVCSGDIRTYSVTAVAGLTYNWTVATGSVIQSGQGSNSISVSYGSGFGASGILSVTASNGCGTSAARSLTITSNAPAIPGGITGPVNICPGALYTYSIAAVSTASSYLWTVPSGAVIQSGQYTNSIKVLWGTTAGNISVSSVNNCGTSLARTLTVSVNCAAAMTAIPDSKFEPNIFPNPSEGIVTLQFYAEKASEYSIILQDAGGRILAKEKIHAVQGANTKQYNWSSLSNGMYLISIESKSGKKVLKLEMR